jgi:hypothetical protein
MSFSPPSGVTFHTTDDVPVAVLSAILRRVASFLQALQLSSPPLRLYHDWWQHDGLHFEKQRITFHELFGMVETPRAVFEATPGDDEVFVGVAPEQSGWYLRFRAEWDAEGRSIVGGLGITVPSDLAAAFKSEVKSLFERHLVEEASESYYRTVMV